MTYYDDTTRQYAERAEAAAEQASQALQQATTKAADAATQANIALSAAGNAATLVKNDLENTVSSMKDSALSAATQASGSATAAAASAVDASQDAISADLARQDAQSASSSAVDAKNAAELAMRNADSRANDAANSASDAADSETAAKASEDAAAISETNAANSAADAHSSEVAAATSEENAENSAKLSQSWAVGGTGVRDDEDTDNAKHYAELAEHFSPVSKADKVTGGDTDGMVAGLDSEGNLTNSGIPVENIAQKDGYYEDMTVGRAENLIDVNATPTPAEFGFRTTAGDVSIDEHGVAVIDVIKGSTEVPNQLVSPTNLNKVSGNGSLEVTDAVADGQKVLELRGAALVKNQCIDYAEQIRTISATGSISVDVSARSATWTGVIGNNPGMQFTSGQQLGSHIYLASGYATFNFAGKIKLTHVNNTTAPTALMDITADTRTWFSLRAPAPAHANMLVYFQQFTEAADTDTLVITLEDFQVVDLTQLFNGDTTKINAVQTWEDLVAILPEYGQYVAYNTGDVVGSNAGWKIIGRNLVNPSIFTSHGGVLQDDGSYYFSGPGSMNAVHIYDDDGYAGRLALKYNVKYKTTGTSLGIFFYVHYTDGSLGVVTVGTSNGQWQTVTFVTAANKQVAYIEGKYNSGSNSTWIKDLQLERGATITAYMPYSETVISPTVPLFAAGTVYDSEDVIAGKRTQRIGRYVVTGNESFNAPAQHTSYQQANGCNAYILIPGIKGNMNAASANVLSNQFPFAPTLLAYENNYVNAITGNANQVHIKVANNLLGVTDYTQENGYTTAPKFKAYFKALYDAGTPLIIYYELATPVITDITPMFVSLQAGVNTFTQISGLVRQAPLGLGYDGTRWSIPANSASKYIVRTDGEDAYVTGVTSIAVDAARNKVIDLTRWFGKGYEPATLAAFYALYPLWQGADIPYMPGSIANFKGTAVVSRFFNAYNYETGTAELLGGNQYQICGTYTAVSYETIRGAAETLDIDADGLFTPVEDGVLTVEGGNDTDTCVHLTWSGYKNYGTDGYRFEKYGEDVRELPVAEYFPQGMNGLWGKYDELTEDTRVMRYDSITFDGSEAWRIYSNGNYRGFALDPATRKYRILRPACASMFGIQTKGQSTTSGSLCFWFTSNDVGSIAFFSILKTDNASVDYMQYMGFYDAATDECDLEAFKAWLTRYPVTVVFDISDTTVNADNVDYTESQHIDPPLNLSYVADDFGTEELLPRNTLENISTTRMNALIRYNLDFTRLGVHVSEIWNYLEDLAKNNADYARAFGYYKQMTVGLAENLIDIHATGENRTFQLDTSCGETSISDDGSASVQVMKGNTVIWNQQFDGHWSNINAWQIDSLTWVLTFKKNIYGFSFSPLSKRLNNHVYLFLADIFMMDKTITVNPANFVLHSVSDIDVYSPGSVTFPVGEWVPFYKLGKATSDNAGMVFYFPTMSESGVRSIWRNVQLYDLTLMFGFGREPQTYEEFLRCFPDPAYPAEASRTVSFSGESIATIGFNQCDPNATHIRVLPQAYQITGPGTLNFYDTELSSAPVAVTYGSTVEPFGFYKNGTKWYRALLGIADYDNTKTYRVNDGVVYNSQWYKCNTQIDTAEEFYVEKWTAVTLEDALADNFLFTPLFIEPDADGIFTPPTRGWLYYEGVTAETCIHFTWSGYRNGEHEDYWREERELPVKQYFPDGMRGHADVAVANRFICDELYPDKAVRYWEKYTFTGNETWVQETTGLGASSYKVWRWGWRGALYQTNPDLAKRTSNAVDGLATSNNCRATTASNLSVDFSATDLYVRNDSCDTAEKIQAFMAGRNMYYLLATPIVTPIDPPLNLTYKVADFGTEQLVPVADSTMPSTPFTGTVRYSTDFTRELVHIVDENVRERVDNLDATIVQKADKDGVYNLLTAGNAYNLIDRHAEGTDRQIGYDTSCGTASISDDGSAEIQELRGSTIQLQNLVADEYQNVFQTGDGYVELPYAYGGEVQPILYGRTYVPNQQVPDTGGQQDIPLWDDHYYYTNIGGVEDIVTGLSTITVTPGTDKVTDLTQMFFPGHEPSTVDEMRKLYPSAGTGAYNPGEVVGVKHSVWTTPVFNQQVQNGDFSDGTTGWFLHYVNGSVSDNELTVTYQAGQIGRYASTGTGTKSIGDKCLCTCEARTTAPADTIRAFFWDNAFRETYQNVSNVNSSEWTRYSRILTAGKTGGSIYWLGAYDGEDADNQTAQIRNVQFVNLTQLFGAGHEPATVEAALTTLTALGKDMTEYHAYDPTGTPVGGTIDMSDSDVELHGFVYADPGALTPLLYQGDILDIANTTVNRLVVKYTFTGQETTWTTVTDASYPNGRYYRFDTNSLGQIYAEGAGKYPFLLCSNPAFRIDKQGGANQQEHSMSVSATRYLTVCSSKTLDEIKAELTGTTIVYKRSGGWTGTVAYTKPMPYIPAGYGLLRQTSGSIPMHSLQAWYDATEYDIRLVYGKRYWFKQAGGEDQILYYMNRAAKVHVVAGQDQLASLECLSGSSTIQDVTTLFALYPYLKTLSRLPYGGPIVNFKGTGIKTVGFNLLNITAEQGDTTGWAATNVPRKFEEGKFYVGLKADNTFQPTYAQFISASASQVNFKGRNYYGLLYPMRCFPNTQYQFTGTRSATNNLKNRMVFYDINGAWISAIEYNANANDSALFTTPENAYWMCLLLATSDTNLNTTRYEVNPCVHLTWSGYRNGDYETYWEETRDLSTPERFPEGMNGLDTIHDTLKSAGTVQNFQEYIFTGTETVALNNAEKQLYQVSGWPVAMYNNVNTFRVEGTCIGENANYMYNNNFVPICTTGGTSIFVHVPGVRTVAQMKEWLNGRKLVYRRATPDPIPYDEPVNLTYKVADFGTEQMIPGNPADAMPTSTALNAIIRYNSDVARTITKLPEDYISKESLADLNSQLGTAIGGVITAAWDASEQKYVYTYTRTPTVVTLAEGTNAHTLQPNMSYIHAPTTNGVTYTLAVPTDTEVDNEIRLDVTQPTQGSLVFKQGTATLALQKSVAPAAGSKWRYLCLWQFGAWKVYPISVQ